jgi:hypothetical protein
VFLLAAMAGLRRNEIDKLPWTALNWDQGTLRAEVTEHFDSKSEASRHPCSCAWQRRPQRRARASRLSRPSIPRWVCLPEGNGDFQTD